MRASFYVGLLGNTNKTNINYMNLPPDSYFRMARLDGALGERWLDKGVHTL